MINFMEKSKRRMGMRENSSIWLGVEGTEMADAKQSNLYLGPNILYLNKIILYK